MATFGEYGTPEPSGAYRELHAEFYGGGGQFTATVYVDQMNEEWWTKVLDAIAGVPGAALVTLSEPARCVRVMGPDRAYEPLPPVDDN
ncbi:hypothetical protein SEA_CROSBY_36 [Streptomyces phage Crosby]|nr:hypothetical protein SEA_CROSBY_36 [Streptomyces phage Crosby]